MRKFTPSEQAAINAAVNDGIAIQHKFRPEPLYKLSGRGYMKSDGVTEMLKIKEQTRGKTVAP